MSLGLGKTVGEEAFPGGGRALAIDCYLPSNWKLQVRELRRTAKAGQAQHAHVQDGGNDRLGRESGPSEKLLGLYVALQDDVKACFAPVSCLL